MTARSVVLQAADTVTLLLALDMLHSYATAQRTYACNADNKLKAGTMQAMLDHIDRLRALLR